MRYTVAAFVAVSLLSSRASAADKVLVYQKATNDSITNAAGPDAQTALKDLGYDAQLVQDFSVALPANLSTYAQLYVVGIGLLPDSDATKMIDYVQHGGRLFLSGERPDALNDAQNTFLQDKVIRPLLLAPNDFAINAAGMSGGTAGNAYDLMTTGGDEADFALYPKPIGELYFGDPGIVTNVAAKNVWATGSDGNASGALWMRAEIKSIAGVKPGCMMFAADSNWWSLPKLSGPQTQPVLEDTITHVTEFLTTCGERGDAGTDPPVTPADDASTPTTPTGDGGAPVGNSATASNGVSEGDSGCGCNVIGTTSTSASLSISALALALASIRRVLRRRSQ